MHRRERYKALQPVRIIETTEALSQRLSRRFPESGLAQLCKELVRVSQEAHTVAEEIRRPIRSLRIASAILILGIIAGISATFFILKAEATAFTLSEFIQTLEAGINDIILIGAAIFFLCTLETRFKRKRALEALHELRSFAHIIDMHQLTKDPVCVAREGKIASTEPNRDMDPFALSRYLDYCSEMLSICGKIAALYIQQFNDAVAIASVNEIENLTTGLSRKIWQKMMIVQNHMDAAAARESSVETLFAGENDTVSRAKPA